MVYDGHMRSAHRLHDEIDTFVNALNLCCGTPYPLAVTETGHRICAGCGDDYSDCECAECENERALSEDDDRASER